MIMARESDLEFISRIQLTCSGAKQDVYFARRKGDETLLVVKGPYARRSIVDAFVAMQEEKRRRGMPCVESECVEWIPDRWPEGVPLGYRNRIDRSRPAPFLVSRSVVPIEDVVFRFHESARWPRTMVMDLASMKCKVDPLTLEGQALVDYANAVGFRVEKQCGDFADRNFLLVSGRVISIDEESGGPIDLLSQLKQTRYDLVMRAAETLDLDPTCRQALKMIAQ